MISCIFPALPNIHLGPSPYSDWIGINMNLSRLDSDVAIGAVGKALTASGYAAQSPNDKSPRPIAQTWESADQGTTGLPFSSWYECSSIFFSFLSLTHLVAYTAAHWPSTYVQRFQKTQIVLGTFQRCLYRSWSVVSCAAAIYRSSAPTGITQVNIRIPKAADSFISHGSLSSYDVSQSVWCGYVG